MLTAVFAATLSAALACGTLGTTARADDFRLHTFERVQLTDTYYSEGIASGDIDGDGNADVVYGPHWYAGPDFKQRHEI